MTDIVGLRIITLYRLDALEVIDALLTAMNRDKSSSAPFVAGSVSEVVIYTANPEGDVQKLPKLLSALFNEHGLTAVTRIDSRPTNYSSIHVAARGRGKYREGYREVPIEIQIRTALEDVWGQIEHGLKYKRKRIAADEELTDAGRRLTSTLDHLGALKTMVDGIAQYADQINIRHPACAEDGVPVARRTSDLWPADDDLQPLQSLVAARHMAAPVREGGRSRVPNELSIDSSHVKAHRSAAGSKKGEYQEAIGRSRGGRTCKIHCLADDRGRPVAIALTPGNVADITMAIPLLNAAAPSQRLLADKAYDADSLRNWLGERRIKAVIPSTASRRTQYPLDRRAYRRRCHRTPLLQAEELATHRHQIRSPCQQLSGRHRPPRCRH